MRERLYRFMQNRYGNDSLNAFMLTVSFILMILTIFIRIRVLYILGIILLILGYLRMMSRDVYRRSRENQRFLNLKDRITGSFSGIFGSRKQQSGTQSYESYNNYKIFKCPECRQKLRVPRGKGKIMITCKRCKREFIKKT